MKLQSKIIWISCLVVIAAMLISDVVIWNLMRGSMREEAIMREMDAIQEPMKSIFDTWSKVSQSPDSEELLKYILKRQNDDYIICIKKDFNEKSLSDSPVVIYNRTILSADDLNNLIYSFHGKYNYASYKNGGKNYIVILTKYYNLELYFIRDISYVNKRLVLLAVGMLGIAFIITILVIIFLNIILGKAFAPIYELSQSARAYKDGNYDVRINVKNNDEIGDLSNNFNLMADAIEQRTQIVKESEMKKTLFIGNLTHEIRTPITTISGYAQTLLMTKLEPEEEEEALGFIYTECGRLERLSRKMMELLNLEKNSEIQLKSYSVDEIFEQTKKLCESKLEISQITLHTESHGEKVTADYDLMIEVLVNLINNAQKASVSGSEIWLYSSTDTEGKKYIAVKDKGCGIPKDEQDKIVEPFYMVDKSRSRKNGGAGLGLALVKMILDKQNMKLIIDSEIGRGTTMMIYYEELI